MSPSFLENAFVFSVKYPHLKLKPQDVVLVNHPSYGKMIKRICQLSDQGLWLVGDNPASVSTQQMGVVAKTAVVGKVICQIKPKS